MKRLLIYAIIFHSLSSLPHKAIAQRPLEFKPYPDVGDNRIGATFGEKRLMTEDSSLSAEALKLGENGEFDFYQLRFDRMICAVPNGRVKMDIVNLNKGMIPWMEKMPNALPEVKPIK